MKKFMTATFVAFATLFFIPSHAQEFERALPWTDFQQDESPQRNMSLCTAHLIQTHFKDSLGYESPQQALLGETFSLLALEVEVDSFEGIEITVVNGALICFDSLKALYSTLLPQIDFDSLRKAGIDSPYCDSLAIQYDIQEYLVDCRLVNVEINIAVMNKVIDVQEELKDELQLENQSLVTEMNDFRKETEFLWEKIEFLIEVVENGKMKCVRKVAQQINNGELTPKKLKKLRFRYKVCQCFAKKR